MACVWIRELCLVAFTKKGVVLLSVSDLVDDLPFRDFSKRRTNSYGAAGGCGLCEYRQSDQHLAGDPLPEADRPVLPEQRGLRHRVQGAALWLEDHCGHQVPQARLSCRWKVQGIHVATCFWVALNHCVILKILLNTSNLISVLDFFILMKSETCRYIWIQCNHISLSRVLP